MTTTRDSPEVAAARQSRFRLANHRERGELLLEAPASLSPADYWTAVRDAWQDSDRQPLRPADWRKLLRADHPDRRLYLMDDQERGQLAALPDRVEVFRGVHAFNHTAGLSWTLDRERAEWFAARHVTEEWPGVVIAARVLRRRIVALLNERSEAEVLVFPSYVYGRVWHPLNGGHRG